MVRELELFMVVVHENEESLQIERTPERNRLHRPLQKLVTSFIHAAALMNLH
jgi:hypothetical protein